MNIVRGFAPIADASARVLILGSMPGVESLRARRYYAHPRNQFWPILCELLGLDPATPYGEKAQALLRADIALWDVLKSCAREGSLDSRIDDATLVPNDFRAFFRRHAAITHVFFNGAKAEACYRAHVLPMAGLPTLQYRRLPSTSPAHAAMSREKKLREWRAVLPACRA
jgi:TDG/mug DNA glycosylase family protein